MATKHNLRSTAIAVVVLFASLGPALRAIPAVADDLSLAELLQNTPHEFDRESLEPSISLHENRGKSRPGVRCATRPIADFEQQFIGSAISEHLRTAGKTLSINNLEIPVHFHILRKKNGGWNITNAQVANQLDVLNQSFAPHGVTFTLDGVSRRKKNRFAKRSAE